ncbi:riboflavin synthase [Paenibacillus koleovorans]|uniref:riboflavin synthase n=1 Tax=Paenibacillus koleovorans TaxID=121608 RepID=UPI000FD9D6C0|nr:riboflavin synthase [Paenibacillus koleovorans]
MFTGIIEEVGRMRRIHAQGQAMVLTIEARTVLEDVKLGDSIAVNGVCLTVIAFDGGSFSVDVMPETYRKTTLRELQTGSRVNLERAMQAGGRFGGHIVQGHVDTTGRIVSRRPEENAVVFAIEPQTSSLMRYMLPHGSITIDGISLTLVRVTESGFTVSIIPHTLAQTVLQGKQPGDTVNLECDILGKYIERLLHYRSGPANGDSSEDDKSQGVTAAFLAKHGFL